MLCILLVVETLYEATNLFLNCFNSILYSFNHLCLIVELTMSCSEYEAYEIDSMRLLSSAAEKEANDSENELNPPIAD